MSAIFFAWTIGFRLHFAVLVILSKAVQKPSLQINKVEKILKVGRLMHNGPWFE